MRSGPLGYKRPRSVQTQNGSRSAERQSDPAISQPSGHLTASHCCRSTHPRDKTPGHGLENRAWSTDILRKKYRVFRRFSSDFSATPIMVFDKFGMKINHLVELYVFLNLNSTFDSHLKKSKFEEIAQVAVLKCSFFLAWSKGKIGTKRSKKLGLHIFYLSGSKTGGYWAKIKKKNLG